ncbi:uncharacterized protein LOC128876634 [Hylaeus volcanicus]|uniref:uncharacterized protein LOC128876634 n=1 Tax=Hylaeus volcanicus TaxID=313075 RepID=UPI0023B823B6|nr:uncharacterized protein LOC128876634 [Hylaeus volcanicus]
MSGGPSPKLSALFPRTGNGTKPKSKICKLTSSKPSLPPIPGSPKKSQKSNSDSPASSPAKSYTSVSSTSPRRIPPSVESSKKSARKYPQLEDRQQALNAHQHSPKASPKRSPRRYVSVFEEDLQIEMGLGLRVSTSCGEEPEMSFLEFESLYTLEKELMQSRQDVGQVDDKCVGGWMGRRGLYTELPDPLYQQATPGASVPSQIPVEGFSFAPGWSLNVEHFYQWQHRGKTTQQVWMIFYISSILDHVACFAIEDVR